MKLEKFLLYFQCEQKFVIFTLLDTDNDERRIAYACLVYV